MESAIKIKKNLLWALVSFVIAVATVYAIVGQNKGVSFSAVFQLLSRGNKLFLIGSVICMLLFIILEGEALRITLVSLSDRVSRGNGFMYASADIYFSAITPSATGGQPACMYFMVKDGLCPCRATASLLLNLLMYNSSIVLIGLVCVIFKKNIFLSYNTSGKILIVVGLVLLTSLTVFLVLALRKTAWIKAAGMFFIGLFTKWHLFRHPEKKIQKLNAALEKYEWASDSLMKNRLLLVKVFFLCLCQRAVQIGVSAFICLAFGMSPQTAANVWFAQAYSAIGTNCLPIPGAMGAIDYLMINGFEQFMPGDVAVNLELLSRGISFYICVIISLATVIGGHVKRGLIEKKQHRRE